MNAFIDASIILTLFILSRSLTGAGMSHMLVLTSCLRLVVYTQIVIKVCVCWHGIISRPCTVDFLFPVCFSNRVIGIRLKHGVNV